jgi:ABC-2 type transport system permease protein
VVFGKFLGVMGFILVMLALTLYFPAVLFIFGSPDPGPIATGYLGVILQAAAFASIGLAISSTTENQIVAAFLSFAINLVLWLSEAISSFVGAPLGAVMKYLSITSHMQDFSRGVIDSRHVIFFLSVIAAALFLTYLSLQTRRWRA